MQLAALEPGQDARERVGHHALAVDAGFILGARRVAFNLTFAFALSFTLTLCPFTGAAVAAGQVGTAVGVVGTGFTLVGARGFVAATRGGTP